MQKIICASKQTNKQINLSCKRLISDLVGMGKCVWSVNLEMWLPKKQKVDFYLLQASFCVQKKAPYIFLNTSILPPLFDWRIQYSLIIKVLEFHWIKIAAKLFLKCASLLQLCLHHGNLILFNFLNPFSIFLPHWSSITSIGLNLIFKNAHCNLTPTKKKYDKFCLRLFTFKANHFQCYAWTKRQ